MEVGKYTQRVLQRIQKIEPENATKIFGYLLLEHSLEEVMEYAVGTEEQIHSLIADAKSYLMSSPKLGSLDHIHPYLSYRHTVPRQCSSSTCFGVPASIHLAENQPHLFQKGHFHQGDVYGMEEQVHPPSPMGNDLPGNFYIPDVGLGLRSRPQLSCHYYYKGYCKHGQSCKFSHGHGNPDCFDQMIGIGLNEFPLEDRIVSPRSLGKLELEIIELLKARRGFPVSLASLPLLYQEMYGKALQAEGYLTESQRHGKVGFSLTKLLMQLRNIRLIDRPHGQHSVVLAEDALKYMDFRSDRNDPGASSSHHIYLTFPAESTFTDADVQNYFSQFGPVHDVRIPRQEKRMFGFVSFYHPQTVQQILAMGHPHYICGSRVLVKPYKEKSRLAERKYTEKLDAQMYPPSLSFDMYNGFGQSACETAQSHSKHEIEDCDQAHHLKGLEMQLRPPQPCLGVESNFLEDQFSSLSITSRKSVDDDKTWQPCSKFNDQNSLQVQLPESPFASPRFGSNNLYTVI